MSDWRDVVMTLAGHFLWQGAAIGLLTWLAVRRIPTAMERSSVLCAGLAAMMICPPLTYLFLRLVGTAETAFTTMQVDNSFVRPFAWYWLAGVAISAARYSGAWLRLRATLKRHTKPAEAGLVARVARVAATLDFRRPIQVLEASTDIGPATFGIWKHVLVVPASAIAHLSPDQLEAILAHEIAHMLRNDFLVGLMVGFAESVFFFHPAVWWLSSEIRRERELCCDQIALGFAGSPVRYANALLGLAESNALAPSMAANGGVLTERVRRLRTESNAKASRSSLIPVLIPALAIMLAACVTPSQVPTRVDPPPATFTFLVQKPALIQKVEKVVAPDGRVSVTLTSQPANMEFRRVKFVRFVNWTTTSARADMVYLTSNTQNGPTEVRMAFAQTTATANASSSSSASSQ